ncbi:MarR family winged helix-turn-helix transcriptional regulator [Clostridium saccharobutylicum]|uniref:Transcriptional regulator, MarR family n=1 Tax=Clostridium saccharobutylicum DSM 13864 TaxID=1345695 RepID=U5MR29_CLOSA|nr:MarR family transcriptional regulator [Clostridium saccharobutylicum]AGX43055.1 transcriptional regulator, MarR family [Clostridium saccharobutylicum DSM 13864]AQR90346.1 transcriptional regulator SlyA [Clostridium saccharobutylicum]AQS00252.1 transcriptional regulator SlyA [Clostridium saccharobutylicum]AQS14235.1 transcriptional regulator SlyA [Clostridium saccharobutylicum]MBA2907607.1 DNA-binding MarR family transcriptional regulator [Clostridium saccharobutylicum]
MNLYGHKVNQLARNFTKKLNEKISPLGLYSSQWGIALYLYEKKQCTQIELCQYLGVEAPTITRTLTRMEEMGLVIRNEGKDKRERLIKLTEKAYEMFSKWHEAAQSLEIEAINNINEDELEIFNNVLAKMMKNLE